MSNDGIVDFGDNELKDWEIVLTNSNNSDSSILNTANSIVNQVVDSVDETLPYLTGVTVTPTLVDFSNANNILPGGFRIQSTNSLLNDQLLITTATTLEPISNISTQTSTETLILTSNIPALESDIFLENIPLEADANSTATFGGPPTLQAVADSSTSVPFEFSPSLGIIIVGFTWWGFSRRKKTRLNTK